MKRKFKYQTAFVLIFTATAVSAADVHNDGVFIFDDDSNLADLLVNDVGVFQGEVCIGPGCESDETFSSATELKIFSANPGIEFNDSSIGNFPNRDWRLRINDVGLMGIDRFSIEDLEAGTIPFTVMGDAPDNALFLDDIGFVGLGTMLPARPVHIAATSSPGIRFEDDVGTLHIWDLVGEVSAFTLTDQTFATQPFRVSAGAPSSSLVLEPDGDVGLGAQNPEGKLHTQGTGVQLAYFESSDGGPVQVRFRTNSENRRFLAVNNANEVQSQVIFLNDRINFTGETDSGANLWLSIGPDGIISQGPTCNPGPCDRTFDRDFFTVPPIEDRAAQMWENQHLPGIGTTQPHAPINLTEKMGGVIHELEVAHIYIEQLHTEIEMLKAEKAQLAAWMADIERSLSEFKSTR